VLVARALSLPLVGSYHTELTAYADLRSGQRHVADAMSLAVSAFYNTCDVVLSPSVASDDALAEIGVGAEKVLRWDRGVDTARFDPSLRDPSLLPAGKLNVLYSGRITREKGADLLADAFLLARAWALAGCLPGALPGVEDRPGAGDWPSGHAAGRGALDGGIDLHLVLAGGGPEQERLAERLGEHATFLGWLSGAELARAYASADLFLFPSATDTFGQVILEAQASGLPVVAVAEGGPLSLIEDRVTGLLREASAPALADAVLELAASPLLRGSLSRAALAAVRERTWERALERLGEGYQRVLFDAENNDGLNELAAAA
jgi:glycosyltransferase involved in cell wall biosynthesis